MPAITAIHRRANPEVNKDATRLLPAIIIGVVAVILLFTYIILRNRALKRHGPGTNRVFATGHTLRFPPVPDSGLRRHHTTASRSHDAAEAARREEVIRRAAERRRLEAIYLEQLNRELAEGDDAEPKPPGYAPPSTDGMAGVTRPEPAAGREGEELPSYVPRAGGGGEVVVVGRTQATQADLDDAVVEAVVADPPPAYTPTPRPGDSAAIPPISTPAPASTTSTMMQPTNGRTQV